MEITEKIDKYLNLDETSSEVLPIIQTEITELIYDWATRNKKHSETFDDWNNVTNKMKTKKEIDKIDDQVINVVKDLEKSMNDPVNIQKILNIVKEHINKIKNKNKVTKALYDFMKEKTFKRQMEEYLIELYKY